MWNSLQNYVVCSQSIKSLEAKFSLKINCIHFVSEIFILVTKLNFICIYLLCNLFGKLVLGPIGITCQVELYTIPYFKLQQYVKQIASSFQHFLFVCSFPGASNESLLAKFNMQHQNNSYYEVPQTRQSAFSIIHYAGKVKYYIQVSTLYMLYTHTGYM